MYKNNVAEVQKAMNDAIKRSLEKIGFVVEAEAKLRCTVDTGTLKRSITNVVALEDKKVSIGTNVEYASYIEKGTSTQKAKPYLTPALEENLKMINDIVAEEFKKIE